MKAKIVRSDQEEVTTFGELDIGDWFMEDGDAGISVKTGAEESLYLSQEDEGGATIYLIDDDAAVIPIQVTISY